MNVSEPPLVNVMNAHDAQFAMWYSPDKIGRHFAAGQLYEAEMLEWVHAQGFTGTAIDVGANIGLMTLWFSVVCGMKVHAFEPVVPHAVAANVRLNEHNQEIDRGQVTVHPVGLGSRVGKFYHVSKGVLRPGDSAQSTDEKVEVRTMDEYGFHGVSLIKIDVEGMELDVLKGGVFTIDRERPTILVEEWNRRTTNGVAAILGPLGYTKTHGFGGRRGRAPMGAWEA